MSCSIVVAAVVEVVVVDVVGVVVAVGVGFVADEVGVDEDGLLWRQTVVAGVVAVAAAKDASFDDV